MEEVIRSLEKVKSHCSRSGLRQGAGDRVPGVCSAPQVPAAGGPRGKVHGAPVGCRGTQPHLRCAWDLAGPSLLCLCLSFKSPLKSYPSYPEGKLILQLSLPAQSPQPRDNIQVPQSYPWWVCGMCAHLSPGDIQSRFLRDIC